MAKNVASVAPINQQFLPIGRWTLLAAAALLIFGLANCSATPQPLGQSVLRVEAVPCVGTVNQLATAILIGPDTALTVAHSFDEIETIQVRSVNQTTTEAVIVYLDKAKDIAILSFEAGWIGSEGNPLQVASPSVDEAISVVSFAALDGPETKPGKITRLASATLDGEGKREAIKLDATIEAGDSGSPVINDDGEIVGMVFATERGIDRGWAIAANELTAAIDSFGNQPTSNPLECS